MRYSSFSLFVSAVLAAATLLGAQASSPRVEASAKVAAGLAQVTGATFARDVLKAKVPVIVFFSAEWSAPSRMMQPVLEELAKALRAKVNIVKINVDENAATTKEYEVKQTPTLILFKQGQPVSRHVGFTPRDKLEPWIGDSL
jgi:thioredoxin 1